MIDGTARSVGHLASAARSGVRTLLPVDSNPVPADWDHVTKVDPEREKRLPLAYPLYLRHTDAISVGGSRDVTAESTVATFDLLRYVSTPVFHEPSAPEHVTEEIRDQAAFLAVPEVLNGDVEALIGELGAGMDHVRTDVAPEMIDEKFPWLPDQARAALADFAASWLFAEANFEAYVIQNPDSDAAEAAGVAPDDVLEPEEAARRCLAAERHLGSEVLYVEYSGVYGDEEGSETVAAVEDATSWSRVWYGGGIDSRERAVRMLEAGADAVVVGDAFHEVAEEEAGLAERALDDLGPDADRARIREWVQEHTDDTCAARYLSTIPSVPAPERVAEKYLVTGIATRLAIEGIAADLESPDAAALGDALSDRPTPGESDLSSLGDRGRAYAHASSLAVLGERTGVEVDSLPADRLAVGTDRTVAPSDD